MRGGVWHRDTLAWLIVAATLPAAAGAIAGFSVAALEAMVWTLLAALGWQLVFLWTRAQPVSPIAVATAFAVGVLAAGDFQPWQMLLAASFGIVLGEQIFGGWGRNVINPAVATLAFLYFAFPATPVPTGGAPLALAVVPGALMLLVTGVLSWQLLLATLLGVVATSLAMDQAAGAVLSQGSALFGLVFLAGDPVASSATRPGRWFQGALAGVLLVLFGWHDGVFDGPRAVVLATLVASLFAPLIDAAVIAATIRSWRPPDA
ncbi:RnfABCDGE type electron transport complex subunit D [Alloalcanivorax sp. C16-2]|uniref:RnfABCDGE type electron transport complex subunit D n=1 Tax=Alloalcanivorax sp. C16-2 TaxID=3390052 RepID=UPI0039709C2F